MSKILYKLDSIVSKTKYKLSQNTKLNNFLKSKILFYTILIIFFILASTKLYIEITNSHNGFQRLFEQNIYKIKHIENKILYGIYFSGILITLKLIKYFKYIYIKKIINLFTLNILLYLGIIYFFTDNIKTQVLLIVTPAIVYFIYKIYNFINSTKEKYKCKILFDSRYLFLIALVLLVYTPIYLYFDDKKIAENLSIYAYYALVVGVIYEIIISKFKK